MLFRHSPLFDSIEFVPAVSIAIAPSGTQTLEIETLTLCVICEEVPATEHIFGRETEYTCDDERKYRTVWDTDRKHKGRHSMNAMEKRIRLIVLAERIQQLEGELIVLADDMRINSEEWVRHQTAGTMLAKAAEAILDGPTKRGNLITALQLSIASENEKRRPIRSVDIGIQHERRRCENTGAATEKAAATYLYENGVLRDLKNNNAD